MRAVREQATGMDTLSLVILMLVLVSGRVVLVVVTAQQQQTIQQLDASIQALAFQRLAPLPRTGVIYNVTTDTLGSSNVRVQAVRLRSGSLRRHGLIFNEFRIPTQSLVETTSKYVVLIYREFQFQASYPPAADLSFRAHFVLMAPVLGIKAYEGTDLSSNAVPAEINIFSGPSAITVRVPFFSSSASNPTPLCAFFDKEGSGVSLSNVTFAPNVCTLSQLVDSSLVVNSSSLAPAPAPAPAPVPEADRPVMSPFSSIFPSPQTPVATPTAAAGTTTQVGQTRGSSSSKAWKLGVGIGLGSIGVAVLATLLLLAVIAARRRARYARMEFCAENSESLQTALIGGSRAPAAAGSRTKPVLENDYTSP